MADDMPCLMRMHLYLVIPVMECPPSKILKCMDGSEDKLYFTFNYL